MFKYIPFDGSIITITELQELFIQAGIDPTYYFVSEAFQIYLTIMIDQDLTVNRFICYENGHIREISSQSLVISSITGINREIINYTI